MTTTAHSTESQAHLDRVRRMVRDLFERTPSFKALPEPDRHRIAGDAVKVLRYLSDPSAGQAELGPVARSLADTPDFAKNAPAAPSGDSGVKQFLDATSGGGGGGGGQQQGFGPAAQAAPGVMQGLVNTVDFPKFVSGLIEGVFTSIVNSSIKQMHEFGKFLEGVVKSVEDFAQDHTTPDQARNYLQNKFPGSFKMDNGKLALDDTGDKPPPDFQAALGMKEKPDLESEDGEQKLVLAAQLKMARMRQQELSTLVLMGINRIVVTEGSIEASVLFDVSAKSTATKASDSTSDYSDSLSSAEHQQQGGGWFSDPDMTRDDTRNTVSTQHTHFEGKTSDEINAHAKLTGKVTVHFKSETFPLEKLASAAEVGNITEKSKR
jgi:hypothetical protein